MIQVLIDKLDHHFFFNEKEYDTSKIYLIYITVEVDHVSHVAYIERLRMKYVK